MPLNFTTPTVGQNNSTEDPLIVTAFNAIKSWANGGVGDGDLASDAVGQVNMKDASVGAAEIIDGSVGANELGANAVTTAKIADDNVTISKLDAPPHCLLAKASYAVPATFADIVFESADEAVDLYGMHSGVTNKTRITLSTLGLYYIHAVISFGATASSFAAIGDINLSGVSVMTANDNMSDTGDSLTFGLFLPIIVSSYVTLSCYQLSGGSRTASAVRFSAIYLGKIS